MTFQPFEESKCAAASPASPAPTTMHVCGATADRCARVGARCLMVALLTETTLPLPTLTPCRVLSLGSIHSRLNLHQAYCEWLSHSLRLMGAGGFHDLCCKRAISRNVRCIESECVFMQDRSPIGGRRPIAFAEGSCPSFAALIRPRICRTLVTYRDSAMPGMPRCLLRLMRAQAENSQDDRFLSRSTMQLTPLGESGGPIA